MACDALPNFLIVPCLKPITSTDNNANTLKIIFISNFYYYFLLKVK